MISYLRLRRNQHIKGSHIGPISNATYITDAWTRFSSWSLNHWRKGWLWIVLITMPTVYSLSFKTSQQTQKSCKYKHFYFMYVIRIKLIRWLITLMMGLGMQPCPICWIPQEQLDAIDHPFRQHDTLVCHEIYEKALHTWTEAEASRICKAYSICKVKVCCKAIFTSLNYSLGLV